MLLDWRRCTITARTVARTPDSDGTPLSSPLLAQPPRLLNCAQRETHNDNPAPAARPGVFPISPFQPAGPAPSQAPLTVTTLPPNNTDEERKTRVGYGC